MKWSGHFKWDCAPFEFIELFAGAAHTSHAWPEPEVLTELPCACVRVLLDTAWVD